MPNTDSYLPERQIIIAGYPRSGNTWLARLLGDVLESPVVGWKAAKPLSEEGHNRKGPYFIRQLHVKPVVNPDHREFLPNAYEADLRCWNGEKVIHIFRDPRDVAVSLMHYWDRESIYEAVRIMVEGDNPVKTHGKWIDFVNKWLDVKSIPVIHTTYELLKVDAVGVIFNILDCIEEKRPLNTIKASVERQSFDTKRQHIRNHGGLYNYGRSIQLKAMRKGIAGDWKNHFDEPSIELSKKHWSEFLFEYGYEV